MGKSRRLAGSQAFVIGSGGGGTPAFRGSGIHMQPPVSYSGSTAWSRQVRLKVRFPVPIRRIRAVLPTFVLSSTNVPDVRLASAINFQVGLEYPFVEASTGLAPRQMFAKSGSKTMLYDPGAGGPWPAIVSDTLDRGGDVIPANTDVGVWCVQERVDRTATASWGPVGTFAGSSTFSVFEVGRNQTTSSIDENWCESASSVTTVSTPTLVYAPLFLVEMADGTVSVFVMGSSSAYGTGEGNNGSLISNGADQNYGDTRGDDQGRAGWIARLLGSTSSFVNCSIGSDRLAYRVAPANNVDRIGLAVIMNPTHLMLQGFVNDISDGNSAATIESNLISVANQYRAALGRDVPLVLPTATPNSTDSFSVTSLTASGTTVTGTMADTSKIAGAQTITIAGATPAEYNGAFPVTIVNGTTFTYTVAGAPGTSPATGTITARTLWATVAGQTATANRGPGSIQDTLNVRIRGGLILANKTIDIARYSQNSLTDTGTFRADSNRPNADTADGVHLNSCGYSNVVGEMSTAGLATTPFQP